MEKVFIYYIQILGCQIIISYTYSAYPHSNEYKVLLISHNVYYVK